MENHHIFQAGMIACLEAKKLRVIFSVETWYREGSQTVTASFLKETPQT